MTLKDYFPTCCILLGERPTIHELVAITKPNGEMLHIMDIISSHSMAVCEKFAHVMLKDPLTVQKLRNTNGSVDDFVNDVLEKWVSSVGGPAVACIWPNLIDCMKKAGMNGVAIQEIRAVVIPP